MNTDKYEEVVIIPVKNFDGVCDEVLDGFLTKLYDMPEKEREKAQNILRGMGQPKP